MTNKPNKSQHVPLLVDRLDIGESTAWLWLKESEGVTAKDLWKYEYRSRRVSLAKQVLSDLKAMRSEVKKPIKYLVDHITILTDNKKKRGRYRRLETISFNLHTLSRLLELETVSINDPEKAASQVKVYAERLVKLEHDIDNLRLTIKKSDRRNTRNSAVLLKRRVQAAITAERTDWTPIEDVAGHLSSQFGVTVKQVAEWYGYNPHSLYGIIGEGRFVGKRPKRALTLIDYYLKENELC